MLMVLSVLGVPEESSAVEGDDGDVVQYVTIDMTEHMNKPFQIIFENGVIGDIYQVDKSGVIFNTWRFDANYYTNIFSVSDLNTLYDDNQEKIIFEIINNGDEPTYKINDGGRIKPFDFTKINLSEGNQIDIYGRPRNSETFSAKVYLEKGKKYFFEGYLSDFKIVDPNGDNLYVNRDFISEHPVDYSLKRSNFSVAEIIEPELSGLYTFISTTNHEGYNYVTMSITLSQLGVTDFEFEKLKINESKTKVMGLDVRNLEAIHYEVKSEIIKGYKEYYFDFSNYSYFLYNKTDSPECVRCRGSYKGENPLYGKFNLRLNAFSQSKNTHYLKDNALAIIIEMTPLDYHFENGEKSIVELTNLISYQPKIGSKAKNELQELKVENREESEIGDPVDSYRGNFVDKKTLLSYSGDNALEFNLNYDSIANDSDSLSSGFTHNFESKLIKDGDNLSIFWNPNAISRFVKENEEWKSTREKDDIQIEEIASGYIVREKENEYRFDLSGKLLSLENLNGKKLQYSYQGNLLDSVVNERNQSFYFEYLNGKLAKVRDNAEREIEFVYDSNYSELKKIIYPNKKELTFYYQSDTKTETSYPKLSEVRFDNTTLVENVYNSTGAIETQYDGQRKKTKFEYDETSEADSITTIMTNPDDTTISKTHNSLGQVIKEKNERGFVRTFEYDVKGNKIRESDFKGNNIFYDYDNDGNVIKVTNPDETFMLYEYNEYGSITKLTDVDGKVSTYDYNDKNQMVKSTDKKGLETRFTYDIHGNVIEQTTEDRTLTRTYDKDGHLKAMTLPNGEKSLYSYDSLGRQVMTELDSGKKIESVYDIQNNLTKQIYTDGTFVSYEYDAFGKKIKETDQLGKVTTYNYDKNGNLISETNGDRGTEYSYDSMNRLTYKRYKNVSGSYNWRYDESGNVIYESDESGNSIKRKYDENNQLISEQVGDDESFLEYDSMNRLTGKTDAEGNKTIYAYNDLGLVIEETSPSGNKTHFEYDEMGRLTKTIDPKGNEYQTLYNDYGEKIKEINPLNLETSYHYNKNGRLISSVNALGQKNEYIYNESAQLIETKNTRGETVAKYDYNPAGRVSSILDGNNNENRFVYDEAGNLLESYNAEGNLISKNEYNQYNEVIKKTNALNQFTLFEYTNKGLQSNVIDALGNATAFTYNNNNTMSISKNADGINAYNYYDSKGRLYRTKIDTFETRYKFNKNDQITLETMPGGNTLSYTYNPESQLSKRINARGDNTSYEYDANGNMVLETTKEGTTAYTYDALNRLIKSESNGNIIEREYDELNRVVKKIQNGKEIGYEYDDLGHLVKIIYPDGKEVGYTYDVMGNMLSVTDWKDNVTAYEYNKNNQLVKTTQSNGVIETREYNIAGQLVALKSLKDEIVITHFTYEYDANGNIIKEVDVKNGKDHLYTYDKLGRLTNANENSYTYSATGNITSYQLTHNGETTSNTMTYNSDNQLNKINGNLASIDKDGNLLTYKLNGKTYVATYDSKNKMIQYGNMYFQYDSEGNRIGIRETGNFGETESKTSFVVDNDSDRLSRILIETKDGKDTYYVYGQGLISEHKDDQVNTYHFDYRGSTVAMTDENGAVIGEAEYDEYGQVLESSIVTRFMYNGQFGIENDENGLYYMRTRYYNLDMKKFMNRDVVVGDIIESQSLNRYAFVNGNPINYTDPFGMARETTESTQAKALGSADMETLHFVLDMIGMFPVVGELADAANVLLYVSEGNYKMASISALAMVPLIGNFATGGKLVSKVAGKIDTAYTATKKAITSGFGWLKKTLGNSKGHIDVETSLLGIPKVVKKMSGNRPNTPRRLLDREGDIGTYNELNKKGFPGDDLTPHHMPSKKFLETSMGMSKKEALKDGLSMNLQQMRKGGIHRKTKTYGGHMTKKEREIYLKLSPRDAIAHDLKDMRRLSMEEGTYPQYKKFIRQYAKDSVEYYNLKK